MPAFIIHGLIGYSLYGNKGFIMGILPDIIGFTPYFYRLFRDYKYNPNDKLLDIVDPKKMSDTDWYLYDISHSLILWLSLLLLTKNKIFYAAIISIIMDIFLHSSHSGGWRGPKFLYPLSDNVFDGISWITPNGILITLAICILFYKYRKINYTII